LSLQKQQDHTKVREVHPPVRHLQPEIHLELQAARVPAAVNFPTLLLLLLLLLVVAAASPGPHSLGHSMGHSIGHSIGHCQHLSHPVRKPQRQSFLAQQQQQQQ
jgi:hypothetical protein